ncbi:MAG: threonine synthase [Clostridia bacterium]|nr:threonine synthase [Clostridia bacterium]
MNYSSTRGGLPVSAAQAIVRGLGEGGGLFVPEAFPQVPMNEIADMATMSYVQRAVCVLKRYLTDFTDEQLFDMASQAYARFDTEAVAPLHELKDQVEILELWHGPTLAFKDVALTLLPHLMTASARATGEEREILILVATSGDTGKAALSGFQDVPGTGCAVFYPKGGVSEAQRLQMVTQRGENTHVIAVRGNFDDAQTGVKLIFSDQKAAAKLNEKGVVLSSANSINWGRLVPQIVYYFSAYADMLAAGKIKAGDEVNFCVPTGNFGNILAAHYAAKMGLPVGKLICASNENNVLTDFIRTGVYDRRREFHLTTSPSMDILISSNLERMLYELCGRDCVRVSEWMNALKEQGIYEIDETSKEMLSSLMYGGWASREACAQEIDRVWNEEKYLIDPHTAVAMSVMRAYREETGDMRPCVVASTASPYKFGRAVADALHQNTDADDFELCARLTKLTGVKTPEAISELPSLPVRHKRDCAPEDMFAELMLEMNF